MSDQKVLTGGCLCGAIRYETWGSRIYNIICHCRMCQRASGGPLAALFYVASDCIKITKGSPHAYRSSATVDRLFCPDCGSPLFFQRINLPNIRAIFVGSLDDPNDFIPALHVCMSSAVPWLDVHDDIPRYDEKPKDWGQTLRYDPVSGKAEAPVQNS
jgi:hypothetical protein